MTAQIGEILIFKGKQMRMATEPLMQYLQNKKEIKFISHSTACWRGYCGQWEIIDNKLYLTELTGYSPDNKEVDLNYLFPDKKQVFADWFSGEIRIPQGEILEYVHLGYASLYEKDLFLVFENGILLREYEVDNTQK